MRCLQSFDGDTMDFTQTEVRVLMQMGESETLEFKKSARLLKDTIEAVCAFANGKGGYVVLGVDDRGDICGVEATDETVRNIANEIKLNTDPKLYPSVEKMSFAEKTCLVIAVEESPLKPHLAYGRPYLRVGSVNQRVDREKYESMLQQRMNGYGFDHQICQNASIQDIDSETLYRFLEIANHVRSLNENILLPPEILLEKLDLLKKGHPTNAAVLLFGKNPGRFFLGQYETKCGAFPSDEHYDTILNDKEYRTNLIDAFDFLVGYMMDATRKKSERQGIYREETHEVPVPVIREGIVNMLVHRDYRQGVKNTIEIRPSRVAFSNPALLFGPTITLEKLARHHSSRPGNKLIAKIFYMMGCFENWGSGTLKIIEECKKTGTLVPKFFFEDGVFRLEIERGK